MFAFRLNADSITASVSIESRRDSSAIGGNQAACRRFNSTSTFQSTCAKRDEDDNNPRMMVRQFNTSMMNEFLISLRFASPREYCNLRALIRVRESFRAL
ncbi:hypothetical protein L596_002029 [Steinernema carpocapsae]|uniref:Uncharacterized protein n=1 Tax=Steinernema carpocapsae TaxID=34508 RepID=A0A4U8UQ17_STECR|nr:hypothetical protein L596_002029 [Steinernema carpocapsae]